MPAGPAQTVMKLRENSYRYFHDFARAERFVTLLSILGRSYFRSAGLLRENTMIVYARILSVLTGITQHKDDKGATAVEYGLLVALIAGVIIVAVTLLGNNLTTLFNKVATTI